MKTNLARSFAVFAALALAFGAAWCEAGNVPADKLPAMCVPKMSKPPTIDGVIDPVEWREAAAMSGLAAQNPGTKLLIMRPTTYYLAWDADNLYLACRTWIMPGYKPQVTGRAPNSVTAFDDGMEFNLKPMGKNVAEGRADSSYKFFISCVGSDGDLARVSVGQLFRSWQPHFKNACRLTEAGSAPLGGRWWECEVVLPAKDFELVGPNRAGDKWRMLLAFNHIPGWMQAAMPINSGYFDASGFPEMTLVENTPCVQVTMDDLPGPLDGVAAVRIVAFNPTAQPVTLNALVQFTDLKTDNTSPDAAAKAVDLLKREAPLHVSPGKAAEFKLNERLPADLGKNAGGIYLRVTQGDRELFRYFTYFKLGYEERWVKCSPRKEAFPVSGTFNPARNSFQLLADAYYLDRPETAKEVRFKVTREGETKPVAEGTINTKMYMCFSKLLQLPELKEGTYNVEAVMDMADGKTLGPVAAQFKKLDETKVFAAWWKNKLGNTERVIKPFEPVSRKGNAVTMWGRTYTLNAVGLPDEVVSQGKAISAAPARIVAVIGGKEEVVKLDGKPKFTDEKPWRCSFSGEAKGAGLAFTATGCVEQDGLAIVNLTFAPAGKEPVRLDALRIEFPLSGQDAECLLCIGPGGNFSSLSHILLPKGKEGLLWSTLETGRGGSSMVVGSFYPDVWMGNEQRGFLWWADSDQGWVPDDDVPAHEVWGVGKDVVLRNNIIGKPFELKEARTITLSYNASPFKPLPKGWRMAIHSEDGTFGGPHKERKDPKTGQTINGWNWLNPPSYDPGEWGALWAEYKKLADEAVRKEQPFNPARARNHQSGAQHVHTSIPLSGYGAQSSDWATTSYFAPEWGEGNFNPTMRDFMIWLGNRAFTEGGLRTIYWDIFYVTSFSAIQAGYGYELPDGRLQPTFHGYNLRQFMMRMYALMGDHGLTPGSQVTHSTNGYPLVAFPWIDGALDGEWAQLTDATTRDWVDFYSTDRMRVMSIAENFGVQISWMSLIHVSDKARYDRIFRGFIDYQRLHDTWTGQDGRFPPNAVLEFGINDANLQFVPYWRNTLVTSADKDVLTSMWRLPDRVLLVVFNYNGTRAKDAVLKVDLQELGLAKGVVAARELGECGDPDVKLDAATGTLAVPGLQAHTARYVGIRAHQQADEDRIRQELAAVGSELKEIPAAMVDWGLVTPRTKFSALGRAPNVTCDDKDVQVAMWQAQDRVLLAVVNGGANAKDATLSVDLDKLGLTPKLPWQEFVRVHNFSAGAPEPRLDFYGRKLTVTALQPKTVRFVGIRLY